MVWYDVTSMDSLEACRFWVKELVNNEQDCQLFLIGTKIDMMPREITEE